MARRGARSPSRGIEPLDAPRDLTVYALTSFDGTLYVAAGEQGLFSLAADDTLRPESEVHVYSLQPVGDGLAAMGNHILLLRQGAQWSRHEFEF